jgi:hypothetical protein
MTGSMGLLKSGYTLLRLVVRQQSQFSYRLIDMEEIVNGANIGVLSAYVQQGKYVPVSGTPLQN